MVNSNPQFRTRKVVDWICAQRNTDVSSVFRICICKTACCWRALRAATSASMRSSTWARSRCTNCSELIGRQIYVGVRVIRTVRKRAGQLMQARSRLNAVTSPSMMSCPSQPPHGQTVDHSVEARGSTSKLRRSRERREPLRLDDLSTLAGPVTQRCDGFSSQSTVALQCICRLFRLSRWRLCALCGQRIQQRTATTGSRISSSIRW